MKNFKLFAFTVLMLSSQVSYTLDVKAGLSWCGNKIVVGCGKVQKYGEDLMIDTPTQAATVVTVVASVCAYKYYHYQAAQACFADKHPNGRIMFKSNLIYMSYSDFINLLESSDSYAEALEFMNERCTSFGFVSDSKVNGFVALATDLQRNNYKRTDGNVEKENIALENFKNNIVLVQANVRQELIDGAISANKNANNVYMVHAFFDILARVFGNK